MSIWNALKPNHRNMRIWQVLVLVAVLLGWHLATRNPQAAFSFGEPLKVALRTWQWFTVGTGRLEVDTGDTAWFTINFPAEIYPHLVVTLTEMLLAFVIGTALALVMGLWLALSPIASAILDPYIKAANSMPRVVLAPIFAMWFGLGIWSKVALANARMLGANARQLLRAVYLPSATSWVIFRPAYLGRPRLRRRHRRRIAGRRARRWLPDPAGRGHFRYQCRLCRHRRADAVCAAARRAGWRR